MRGEAGRFFTGPAPSPDLTLVTGGGSADPVCRGVVLSFPWLCFPIPPQPLNRRREIRLRLISFFIMNLSRIK